MMKQNRHLEFLQIPLIIMLLITTSPTVASDRSVATQEQHYFLLLETGIASISLLAAENPRATGYAGLLLAPLFLSDRNSFLESCAITCYFVLMSAYNLHLDSTDKSDNEIFKENFLGWNLGLLTYYLAARSTPGTATSQIQNWSLELASLKEDKVFFQFRLLF